jgi:hypothetical protein
MFATSWWQPCFDISIRIEPVWELVRVSENNSLKLSLARLTWSACFDPT